MYEIASIMTCWMIMQIRYGCVIIKWKSVLCQAVDISPRKHNGFGFYFQWPMMTIAAWYSLVFTHSRRTKHYDVLWFTNLKCILMSNELSPQGSLNECSWLWFVMLCYHRPIFKLLDSLFLAENHNQRNQKPSMVPKELAEGTDGVSSSHLLPER